MACLMPISRELWYPSEGTRGICYDDFPMDNIATCLQRIKVRYMWWVGEISGLECFSFLIWIIIRGPPLETFRSIWRYIPTKRHGQYRRFVSDIIVPHCSTMYSAAENFPQGIIIIYCYRFTRSIPQHYNKIKFDIDLNFNRCPRPLNKIIIVVLGLYSVYPYNILQ